MTRSSDCQPFSRRSSLLKIPLEEYGRQALLSLPLLALIRNADGSDKPGAMLSLRQRHLQDMVSRGGAFCVGLFVAVLATGGRLVALGK